MPNYYILIPAYKPPEAMLDFLDRLSALSAVTVVVNDGSGPEFEPIFDRVREKNIQVLSHAVNGGKGKALKTGIAAILGNDPDAAGVVTADCDGQHTAEDIRKVLNAMEIHPDMLVMGCRAFDKDVPARSMAGNTLMSLVFLLASGIRIRDTQTGLRGLPAVLLPELCELDGDRYEYEMNMLLHLREWGVKIFQVPIATIYINQNSGSHFNSIRDSLIICGIIFKYLFASFIAFLVEYTLFSLCVLVLRWPVQPSFWVTRILSAFVNYLLNKKLVFRGKGGWSTLVKYYLMVVLVMLLGGELVQLLNVAGLTPLIGKPLVDGALFFVNFFVQRDVIFRNKRAKK